MTDETLEEQDARLARIEATVGHLWKPAKLFSDHEFSEQEFNEGVEEAATIYQAVVDEQARTITEQESLIEDQQDTLAAWTFLHSTLIGASAAVGVHESYRVLAQGLLELIPDDRLQSERIDAMMAVLRANRGKLR